MVNGDSASIFKGDPRKVAPPSIPTTTGTPQPTEKFQKEFKEITKRIRRSRGGGGSRTTTAPTKTTQQVQQEAIREGEAQQLEIQRQQRIEAGKIVGQLSDVKGIKSQDFTEETKIQRVQPLAIEAFDPQQFKFQSGFRRSPVEATKSFFTQIPGFVSGSGRAIGNLLAGDTTELKKIDPFRVFKEVGKKKGERQVSAVPQFGTITPDAPTGFIVTTEFDILKQQRRKAGVPEELVEAPISVIGGERVSGIEREVVSGFQRRVDAGDITVEQAQKEAEQIFKTRVEAETKGLEKLSAESLSVREGEIKARQVKSVLPAVGLTALSLTPTGAIIGGSLAVGGGAFLATRGKQKIKEGDIRGGVIDIGTGALFAGGGFASLGGAAGRLEAQLTASRLAELQRQPLSLGGDFTVGKRGVITKVSGSRVTQFGTQEVEVISPVFTQKTLPTGTQSFSIVGGRVTSQTRLEPFRFIGGFSTPKVPILKSTEAFSFIGRGIAPASGAGRVSRPGFTIDFPKEFKTATGTLDFVREGKRVTTPFASVAKKGDSGIDVISGPLVKARVGAPELGFQRTFVVKPEAGGRLIERPSKDFFLDFKVIKTGGIPVSPQASLDTTKITSAIRPTFKPTPVVGGVVRTGGAFPSSISQLPSQDFGSVSSGSLSQSLSLTSFKTSEIGAGFGAGAKIGQLVKPSVEITKRSFTPIVSLSTSTQQLQGFQPSTRQLTFQATEFKTETTQSFVQQFDQQSAQRSKQATRTITQPTTPTTPIVSPVISPRRGTPTRVTPGISAPFGPFPFLPLPTFPTGRVAAKGRKKKPSAVAPSLTGLTFFELGGITGGPLPTSGLPEISFVPESFVKKKKKKKKKK